MATETGRGVSTTDQVENVTYQLVHNKVADRAQQAWQPECGLEQANLFSSTAFTTTQTFGPALMNANHPGLEITVNTTVAPGGGQSFAVIVDHLDFVTGTYFPAETIGTVTGAGQSVFQTAKPVPQSWQVRLVPSGAGTWTASGSYSSLAALKQEVAVTGSVAVTQGTTPWSVDLDSPTPAPPARVALTNATEQTLVVAPGAGLAIHVTDMTGSNEQAVLTRVDLKEGAGGTIRYSYVMAPRGGGFAQSLRSEWILPANTALVVQQTAMGTAYVTVNYYVE